MLEGGRVGRAGVGNHGRLKWSIRPATRGCAGQVAAYCAVRGGARGKVAKMATVGSKVATRLPSTGLKMPKIAT